MQSGQLIVVGNNKISIPLHSFPAEVEVKFKDDGPVPSPCDPGSVDFISYEVSLTDIKTNTYALIITWSVSSVREVSWHAAY